MFSYLIFVDHAGILGIPKIPQSLRLIFTESRRRVRRKHPLETPLALSVSLFVYFLTGIIVCFITLFYRTKKELLWLFLWNVY
jgi:hypothetical protein